MKSITKDDINNVRACSYWLNWVLTCMIITLGATTSSRWEGNAAGERESKFITASKDEGTAPTCFKELSSDMITYYRQLIDMQLASPNMQFFGPFLQCVLVTSE